MTAWDQEKWATDERIDGQTGEQQYSRSAGRGASKSWAAPRYAARPAMESERPHKCDADQPRR